MPESIGIIGLGRIGMPAAKKYLAGGYKVAGCNVRRGPLDELASLGGIACESPAQVAKHASLVLILVVNDAQVKEVIGGKSGLLSGMEKGSVVVCMSTVNQTTVQKAASQCAEKGIDFIDCPFTGGPARIPAGKLTLIAAGKKDVIEKSRTLLEVTGHIVHAGESPGLGQAVKHCNQLLVGATHAATVEVITLARRLGLPADLVTSVIAGGIAGSDYFRLLSESILKNTPSPGSVGQMSKDMAIVKNTLDERGVNGLVGKATAEYFALAMEMGMKDREGAALIEVVEKISSDR